MNAIRNHTSFKVNLALFILSTAILLVISGLSYNAFKNLKKSSNLLKSTLKFDGVLSQLLTNYDYMEMGSLEALILQDSIKYQKAQTEYRSQNKITLGKLLKVSETNAQHQTYLNKIAQLQDEFYEAMVQLTKAAKKNDITIPKAIRINVQAIHQINQEIHDVQIALNKYNKKIIADQQELYDSQKVVTPLMSFLGVLFSVGIFIISFLRLNKDRKNRLHTEDFLNKIVSSTEDNITYYQPEFDTSNQIIDFKILFTNTQGLDSQLSDSIDDVKGRRMSEVYPSRYKKDFDSMVRVLHKEITLKVEDDYEVKDHTLWLSTLVNKLNDGVITISKNITETKNAELQLKNVNKDLKVRNVELLATKDFLQGILRSTNNVVSYFEPFYNDQKEITDFIIKFTNEVIIDVTGDVPKQIEGKFISEVYPFLMENGVFECFIKTIEEGVIQHFDREYEFNGDQFFFSSTSVKTGNGITVTSRDITEKQRIEIQLLEINEQLKQQNNDLADTRAFLENIMSSTTNVVSYFLPVRDAHQNIVDFTVAYTNDRIKEASGEEPKEVFGKKVSEVYPYLFENGLFEILVSCIEKDKMQTVERVYNFLGEEKAYRSTVVKLNDGVTLTSNNVTVDRLAEQQLKEFNRQLTLQNTALKEAESIAKIGNFRWDITDNTYEISDNYFHLLGYDVDEFVPSEATIKNFVHPGDSKFYQEAIQNAIANSVLKEFTFRVIDKHKQEKFFKSSGQLIAIANSQVLVGIVEDVTEKIRSDIELNSKNQELKNSNKELEAFNHIASHDLQEPLRKIQIFISLILDMEGASLSAAGIEYFGKVQNAATRMRSLIKYLLTYSRISKTHTKFDLVELQEILQHVEDDLNLSISEKGARLHYNDLPAVHGIAFQLEQLFSNLLSNSLKYSKADIAPLITIDCTVVNQKDISFDFLKNAATYHRIVLKDNGIGFDQKNANKIFEVFQRLHHREQYSGTGIGLAICKKIVENHHGYIHAISEEDNGASFIIYIPIYHNVPSIIR